MRRFADAAATRGDSAHCDPRRTSISVLEPRAQDERTTDDIVQTRVCRQGRDEVVDNDRRALVEDIVDQPVQLHLVTDLPYWPLRGADILSLWVAFDAVPPEAGAMRYVRASHKAGVMYAPRASSKNSGYEAIYAAMELPAFPDLGDLDHRDDVLVCPVEPGDVIVHHPLTFHRSPGNMSPLVRRRAVALRYIGDDAVYDARPGTFVENSKIKAVLKEPIAYRDGDRIGGANFPRVL